MKKLMARQGIPESAIVLRTYADLDRFVTAFASGKLSLLVIVSNAGLQKSRGVLSAVSGVDHVYLNARVSPFGMYLRLFENRDKLVVLDDADQLYADKNAAPLLKALCDTVAQKTVSWDTTAADKAGVPRSFTTHSKVCILCNSWNTVNRNLSAVLDRGHVIHFQPSVYEVHRRVKEWFTNKEVFTFIEENLPLIFSPSMRYYFKGGELKDGGFPNWRDLILSMLNPDLDNRAVEETAKLMNNPHLSATQREKQFMARTKMSRATWHNYRKLWEESHSSEH